MQDFGTTDKRLGMIYTKENTSIRVWSPIKDKIYLNLYSDRGFKEKKQFLMDKKEDGVHEIVLDGDYKGYFYTFLIDEKYEVTDPYSIASALNSKASAIIDLEDTNPKGFKTHRVPKGKEACDAIIYEVHIKDFTISETSGVKYRGKYLGFIEEGTNYNGYKTGLDHLKELGVTHIHLMPVYDFFTVDEREESFYLDENYNWGYDPELYNVPQGSYASNPEDPINRIKELKMLIMKLHEEGFKVILDVVYNHTYKTEKSNFNRIMPTYYHRTDWNGRFSNGSGTGNEIATEMPMVRKFIIESLVYWVEEYKIDGFRFDLMALIDKETIKQALDILREINPNILVYGEPWAASSTLLPADMMTVKGTQKKNNFAFFNDEFRDALKGDNNGDRRGFVQGNGYLRGSVETGIAGSIYYDNRHIGFTNSPRETINYINSHDDLIIYDKIKKTFPHMAEEDRIKLNKFAFSILFTSQGIPFFHEGNEFLRTKYMISNTYNKPASINAVDWTLKEKNIQFYNYFKDLIILRKRYKEFRMCEKAQIVNNLKFFDKLDSGKVIAFTLKTKEGYLLIVHNANFYGINIDKSQIKTHLIEDQDFNIEDIEINIILDEEGLVENEKNCDILKVPYFSTIVYTLK